MSIFKYIIRGLVVASGVAVGLIIFAGAASAAPKGASNGDTAVTSVESADCLSVTAHSTKDLSNVVLQFADGSVQKFDGLTGHDGTFSGTGANDGKVVTGAWVKSGSNFSDDGPGYGEYHAVTCTTTGSSQPATDTTSTPAPGSSDDTHSTGTSNNSNGASNEEHPSPAPAAEEHGNVQQPSSSNIPASVGNALTEERPAPTHAPDTLVSGAVVPVALPAPAAETAVAASAAAHASSGPATQVLGVQYTAGAESLAVTGSTTVPMTAVALVLLALGIGMIGFSRRPTLD